MIATLRKIEDDNFVFYAKTEFGDVSEIISGEDQLEDYWVEIKDEWSESHYEINIVQADTSYDIHAYLYGYDGKNNYVDVVLDQCVVEIVK